MNMNNTISRVPPGFRFHPTDEELVDYYLRKKVAGRKVDLDVIKDVDLYKLEPWDLQEICRIGAEEQNEWYLFSHKDKKYPTGTRTNRATSAGFWKATGRDKPIYSKLRLVGMRKTLVYYKGRAPNGQKSDWIMHEYRLETNENGPPQEEGWVVCRVFKKRLPSTRRSSDDLPWYNYEEQANSLLMQDYIDGSPSRPTEYHHRQLFSYKKSDLLNLHYHSPATDEPDMYELPPIENTKSLNCYVNHGSSSIRFISTISDKEANMQQRNQLVEAISIDDNSNENTSQLASDQVTDWRVLDKFVASQLSHGGSQQPIYSEEADHDQILQGADEQEVACMEFPSIAAATSCQIYPWK